MPTLAGNARDKLVKRASWQCERRQHNLTTLDGEIDLGSRRRVNPLCQFRRKAQR
jgi:hypothetical protein